jgi:hypothetical protein
MSSLRDVAAGWRTNLPWCGCCICMPCQLHNARQPVRLRRVHAAGPILEALATYQQDYENIKCEHLSQISSRISCSRRCVVWLFFCLGPRTEWSVLCCRAGLYKLPWDMTTFGHRQTNPLFVLRKVHSCELVQSCCKLLASDKL